MARLAINVLVLLLFMARPAEAPEKQHIYKPRRQEACITTPYEQELSKRIQKTNAKITADERLSIIQAVERFAPYFEQRVGLAGKIPRCLYYGVIHVESHYNPRATSKAPARGLMQVTPIWRGRCQGYVKDEDLYQITPAIQAGCQILAGYLQRSKGDLRTALAYYNAGPAGAKAGRGWDYADKVLNAAALYEI